jgi:hypothetical protein
MEGRITTAPTMPGVHNLSTLTVDICDPMLFHNCAMIFQLLPKNTIRTYWACASVMTKVVADAAALDSTALVHCLVRSL